MPYVKVSIGEAVSWVGRGWRLFTASPGMWLLIGLVALLIHSAVQMLPFIGLFISILISPLITAGLLFAAREVDAGRPLHLEHLFQGFREPGRMGPLFGLGGVYVGGVVITLVLCVGALMVTGGFAGLSREELASLGLFDEQMLSVWLVVLAAIALFIPVLAALYYATPLVMFHGVPVWTALGSSLMACLRNFIPLMVFGLVLLLLFLALGLILMAIVGLIALPFVNAGNSAEMVAGVVVGVVIAMIVMFLASIPVIAILSAMNYHSYRSVYQDRPACEQGAGMAG